MNKELKIDWPKDGLHTLELELKRKGVDIIRFADLSSLSETVTRGFSKAILIGILLSKEYVIDLYKATEKGSNEFAEKERRADELAEWTAEYLQKHGYMLLPSQKKNFGRMVILILKLNHLHCLTRQSLCLRVWVG